MEYSRITNFLRYIGQPTGHTEVKEKLADGPRLQAEPTQLEKCGGSKKDSSSTDVTDTTALSKCVIARTYTMSEVSMHCHHGSCWVVIMDKVYDITCFIREHPAGEDIIIENAGRDVTVPFSDVGHSKDAILMLEQYCIGSLTENERVIKRKRHVTV